MTEKDGTTVTTEAPETTSEKTKPQLKPGWQILADSADAILNAPLRANDRLKEDMASKLIAQCICRAEEIIPDAHEAEVVEKVLKAICAIADNLPGPIVTFAENHIGQEGVEAFINTQEDWVIAPCPVCENHTTITTREAYDAIKRIVDTTPPALLRTLKAIAHGDIKGALDELLSI